MAVEPGTSLRAVPRWTRLATLGLVMAALGPLLMLAAGLIWGLAIGSEAVFFLIPGVAGLLAAYLVARFGTWAKIVGAVVGFFIAFMLFWTAFGIQAPQSFFDFAPALLVIPGGLLALVASIASIVAKRRGHLTDHATGGERTWVRAVVGVVGTLGLVSAILTVAGRTSADATGTDTTVIMKDFKFDRREYSIAGGSKVLAKSRDPFLHTFTVDELDIDVTMTPGDKTLITIPAKPGTYILYCRPHADAESPKVQAEGEEDGDMAARLVVT